MAVGTVGIWDLAMSALVFWTSRQNTTIAFSIQMHFTQSAQTAIARQNCRGYG